MDGVGVNPSSVKGEEGGFENLEKLVLILTFTSVIR